MRVLVVGGTLFVGRALVAELLEHGHAVTLFNRGRRPNPFEGRVELIRGDRREHDTLPPLFAGRTFDACVDTCGYLPADVATLLDALGGRTRRYVFCSTCSVYDTARADGGPLRPDSPLVESAPDPADIYAAYGWNKVLCEREALGRGGFDTTVIRPSYIYGPHEPYYREMYFFERAEAGRTILLPDHGANTLHWGHVADLARVFARCLDHDSSSGRAYPISGPAPLTLREFAATAWRAVRDDTPRLAGYPTATLPEEIQTVIRERYDRFFPFDWTESLAVDNSPAVRDLDWTPSPSLEEGLAETYRWWTAAGRLLASGDFTLDDHLLPLATPLKGV